MTSKQIECFLSVASTLNFSHSAKELYASQSTVSRQISLLEEELGFSLFVRGNNYVRLTPAGITMMKCFSEMEQSCQTAIKTAAHQSAGATGFLKLGFYCNMFIEETLLYIIQEFHNKYPNIILNYECIPFGNLDNLIRTNGYDLVFIHDFDELSSSEFVTENVCMTHQYLMYGNANPKASREHLTFLDFKDEIFWSVANRTPAKRTEDIRAIMKYYHVDHIQEEQASNFETMMLNVRLGNGVVFLDPITHHYDPRYYGSVKLPEEISRIGINVAWLKNNFNPAIPLFVNQFIC